MKQQTTQKNELKTEETEIPIDTTSEELPKQKPIVEKKSKKVPKKGKLNLTFTPDSGDDKPPAITKESQQETKPKINYEQVATGFIGFVDMIFQLISKISKDQITYEKLTDQEKKICVDALKQETQVLDAMNNIEWFSHIIVLGTLCGIFIPKLKIKKKEKSKDEIKKVEVVTSKDVKKETLKKITIKPKEVKIEPSIQHDDIEFLETSDIGNIDHSNPEPLMNPPKTKRNKNYGQPVEGGATKLVQNRYQKRNGK